VSGSRREFLRQFAWALVPVAIGARPRQDGTVSLVQKPQRGGVAADTLAFPLNTPGTAIGPLDNDPTVIAIERRLRCTCGCTLDVYTCRTTDFACTYSPAMHRTVVEHFKGGEKPDVIVQWFVNQPGNGEKVLMSPPARGFNVMGYVIPGVTVAAAGLGLVAWMSRARAEPAPAPVALPTRTAADADKLAQLKRALDDVDS